MVFDEPTKKCAKLTAKLITATYKSKFIMFKLDEDLLQSRVCLLSFLNSLKIVLSIFLQHTYYLWTIHP